MNSASTARVKEKIRYDINVHRQQNKQILLNSRRGVVPEEKDSVFTVEDMKNLAIEIKHGKQITAEQLNVLKNGFLNGVDFVLVFCHVHGAVDSLLHLASSKNEDVQLAAIECFCNMTTLGDKKTCLRLTKVIAPYLMMYINHLNFNISAMSIWTLGNLSDSSQGSCKVLQSQNFFTALVDCLQTSTCDEVIFNTFYALRLFLKNYMHHLETYDLNKLLLACFERLTTWKESFWIVYQISCCQDIGSHDSECMDRLLSALREDIIDTTCLVPILRTFSNIIAKDFTNSLANVFIYGLQHEEGFIIRNILINNRDLNLNDECAWLLGNVFKSLNITELNENGHSMNTETFNEICNYFLI